jgi:multidrug efflux pump subunit AcrB
VRAYYVSVLVFALERRRVFVPASWRWSWHRWRWCRSWPQLLPERRSGQISLHVRAPVGTRLEETAALFDHIEDEIRRTVPKDELVSVVDNIGLPVSGINRAYSNTGGVGPQDGDILITLGEGHRPTAGYVRACANGCPGSSRTTFSFLPADIISQILNFGSPAPIDVMVTGPNVRENEAYAHELVARMQHVGGIADVRLQQASTYPELRSTSIAPPPTASA